MNANYFEVSVNFVAKLQKLFSVWESFNKLDTFTDINVFIDVHQLTLD